MKSLLIFLALVIVGGAGYLLYLDYNHPSTSVQNPRPEPIGLLDGKQNDVQRQMKDNSNWENIDVLAPLFSGDHFETLKNSSAHIKTNSGLIVEVRENTLLSLEKEIEGPAVELKSGDIFSKNITTAIEFNTRGAIIKGDQAAIHITTDLNGKSRVEAPRGKISIVDKINQRLDLLENGSAELNDGVLILPPGAAKTLSVPPPLPTAAPRNAAKSASSPKPTPAKGAASIIDLIKPDNGSVLNLEPETNNIEFDWSSNTPSKFFVLEVSTTNDFKKILQSHNVNLTKDSIKDLKPQNYFWRIKAFDAKNKVIAISKAYSFNLKIKLPILPELVTPAAEITWTDPSPIEFTWKKMDLASKYRVSVYSDLSQHNEVKSQVTDATTFLWNWQIPKSYYWTVKGLNAKGVIISQSEVRHFTIAGAPKDKAPTFVIISPKDQTEIVRDLSVEKPEVINFQWRVTKTLPGPLSLIISNDPEFKDPMTLKNVTKSLVPVTLKKEGIYYWNLSSQSDDGRDLELSPVITFNLKAAGSLMAPKIIEPLNDAKVESEDPKAIKFSWKRAKNAVQYHFVLKRMDPNTKEPFIILDRTVKETTFTSEPLDSGDYSWNVFAKDSKDREKGQDKDYNFVITNIIQMDSPKLKEPVIK